MHDAIVAYLSAHQDEYLGDLVTLAGIDSGSYGKDGIDEVQAWLADAFAAEGFDVERIPETMRGDNIAARRRGKGIGRILLIGHADTVYPKGTAAERPLRYERDKLLGPGTCDMKAGILTGLYAARALKEIGWNDFELLTVAIVSDEEIEDRRSVELLRREGARHDAVLTLEAARENGDIVVARKASRWWTATATGRAAHAGVEPEKGASATLAIARLIVEAAKLNGLKLGMTVNPGRIEGGDRPNVVAAHASVVFDLRAWTNAEIDELSDALQRVAGSHGVPGVAVALTMNGGSGMPAMERSAGVARLEAHAVRIANELGFDLSGTATGGASDVSHAVHAGTPGLDGLGPVGGRDHSPDEYILVSSIVPRTALLASLLQAICADSALTAARSG